MIEGKKIAWAGREWNVPGLGLRAHLHLEKETIGRVISAFSSTAAGEQPENVDQVVDDCLDVATAALSRNYPTITRAELENMLELSNYPEFLELIGSILIQSFRRRLRSGDAEVNPQQLPTPL